MLLRNQLMAQRVEAQIEVEPDLPMPDIDPNQIQQVFVNLINNAAQAIASTGRPGRVLVRARRWLDGVAIDVIDDGPGMSEALAAQVFEPFFTTKPEGEGTGLGLSISQGIVNEHGGRIMLSTEEGRGSTFTVQLPLSTRSAAPTPGCRRPVAQPPASGPRRRRRAPHSPLHARHLRGVGPHSCRGAERAKRPWSWPTREQFDLIISDLRMPGLGAGSSTRSWCAVTRARRPSGLQHRRHRPGDTSPSSRAWTGPTSTSLSASPSSDAAGGGGPRGVTVRVVHVAPGRDGEAGSARSGCSRASWRGWATSSRSWSPAPGASWPGIRDAALSLPRGFMERRGRPARPAGADRGGGPAPSALLHAHDAHAVVLAGAAARLGRRPYVATRRVDPEACFLVRLPLVASRDFAKDGDTRSHRGCGRASASAHLTSRTHACRPF